MQKIDAKLHNTSDKTTFDLNVMLWEWDILHLMKKGLSFRNRLLNFLLFTSRAAPV